MHDVAVHGADWLGVFTAVVVAIGLRSGARGGPLALERAEVRHVLLAPVDRTVALRGPADPPAAVPRVRRHRRRRRGRAAGRRPGSSTTPGKWMVAGAAYAVATVAAGLRRGAVRLARCGCRRRWPRRWASSSSPGRWPTASGSSPTARRPPGATSASPPTPWSGPARSPSSSRWRWRPWGLRPGGRHVAGGGRAPLVAGRADPLRRHPAGRAHGHRPAPPAGHGAAPPEALRAAADPRAWRGSRCGAGASAACCGGPPPGSGRLVLLGVVAGLALRGAWEGTTPLIAVGGLALYVAALDAVEALAEEVDRPTRSRTLPMEPGELHVRHLPVAVAVMVLAGAVAAVAAVAARPVAAGRGRGRRLRRPRRPGGRGRRRRPACSAARPTTPPGRWPRPRWPACAS